MRNNIFLTSDAATVIHDVIKHFDFENNKKVLFVETSGETHQGEKRWIDEAIEKMKQLGFELEKYTITDKTESEIRSAIRNVDILYVAGGNTAYLLNKSQENNFAKISKEFIDNGGIYIGQSAGSIVAGPDIYPLYKTENDQWFKSLKSFDGFHLVDFIIIPHFGHADKKDRFFNHRFKYMYNDKYKIILLADKQYVRVQEDGMYKIEEI